MGKFVASVLIDSPAEEVWDFVTDLSNLAKTTPNAPELRHVAPGPLGLGTTFSGKDGRLSLTVRVTAFDPNRRFVGEFVTPRFMKGTTDDYALESIDGKTRLTETWDSKLNGLFKVLGPFFAPRTKRDVITRLDNVKRILETRPQS